MTENRNPADLVPKSYTEWFNTYITVDQYWVDTEVYNPGTDEWIDSAIRIITRTHKIDSIGI